MKTETKQIAPEVLLEEYREILNREEHARSLPLLVIGDSMQPFLVNGRDTVFLSRLNRPARRGDILLYRRSSGAYVLHRVWKAAPDGLTMVGDAQKVLEPGIRPEQVIAVVTGVERKGKLLGPGDFWWEFFAKIWISIVPFRSWVHGIYSAIRG